MKRYATALLLSSRSFHVYGFTTPSTLVVRPKQTSFLHSQSDDASSKDSSETIFYNDFEDYAPPSTTSGELNFSDLFQERVKELKQDERRLLKNWRSGRAKSYGAFTINERYLKEKDAELPFDWVRRVDIGEYPRVACGSAHGSIFVADVSSKNIVAEARGVHYSQHNNAHTNNLDEQLRQLIYGDFDGGGVLDVAMYGNNLVASSGREGGVKIFKLAENKSQLVYGGEISALIRRMPGALPVIVTSMKFDSLGRLFLGCSDGFLRVITFPEKFTMEGVKATIIPPQSGGQPSPILALDISEQLGMVVTAHASGDVCVYSVQEKVDGTFQGELAGTWNPFVRLLSKCHARSVVFASMKRRGKTRHAVAVGGGNGEIWINDIDPTSNTLFDGADAQKFKPDHAGPVLALASRPGGIVVSVGQDGLARVTHAWLGRKGMKTPLRNELAPLYGIGGLKVWVGSVCIDKEGKRLVSDGFDDAVVIHDFSCGDDMKESDEL